MTWGTFFGKNFDIVLPIPCLCCLEYATKTAHDNAGVDGCVSPVDECDGTAGSVMEGTLVEAPLPLMKQPRAGAKLVFDVAADAKPADVNKGRSSLP